MVVPSTKSHIRTAEVRWRRAQDACLMLRNPLPSKIPAVLTELRPAQTTTASTATYQSPINPPKRWGRLQAGPEQQGQGLPAAPSSLCPTRSPSRGRQRPPAPRRTPRAATTRQPPALPPPCPPGAAASGAARGLLPYQRAPGPPAAAATSRRPPAAPAPRPWPPWRRSAHAAAGTKWRLRHRPAAPGSLGGAGWGRPARRHGRAGRCEALGSPAPTRGGRG